jgi:putative PIN family toxin of toxin-antitoxin system
MRVVLDTNVLISAALKPGGLEAALVNDILGGRFEVWVTNEVWAEYEEVLARPKFAGVRAESRRILDSLQSEAHQTTSRTRATAATDEDDNRFLECAEAAEAHYLISGNLRHYPAAMGLTIVTNARGLTNALNSTDEPTASPHSA